MILEEPRSTSGGATLTEHQTFSQERPREREETTLTEGQVGPCGPPHAKL